MIALVVGSLLIVINLVWSLTLWQLRSIRMLNTDGDLEEVFDALLEEVALLPVGIRSRIMSRIHGKPVPKGAVSLLAKLP